MSNEKKNKDKDETKLPRLAAKTSGAGYLGRQKTLMGAVTLSKDLMARGKPVGMGAAVDAAFEGMVKAHQLGRAGDDARAEETTVLIAEPRNSTVAAYVRVTSTLDVQMESGVEPLASEARAVSAAVFSEKRPVITALAPEALAMKVESVKDRLTGSPGLRKRLEALVRPELVQLLLDRHAELAGAVEAMALNLALRVDAKRTTAIVNDAINYFAICVLATAPPGDVERRERAEALLRPILAHRAKVLRRNARRVGGVAEEGEEIEEEDAGDEPMTEPADPPATPS